MSEPGKSPRQFSSPFKEAAVRRLEDGEKVAAVAAAIGVRRKLLYQWRDAWRAMGSAGFNRKRGRKPGWKAAEAGAADAPSSGPDAAAPAAPASQELRKVQARIGELERVIGRQQADLHFFSRSLAALGRDEPTRRRAHLYAVIEKMIAFESQGFLEDDANIRRLCALGDVSRAGYYRHFDPHAPAREDADLRDLIQRIALADRHCGYRRVTHTLRRQGLIVNAKRVLRLMREDNLLSLRARPFVPRTTMSRRGFAIRPNLARSLRPTGLDQL